MGYESRELIKIYEYLSKKGIKTSEKELLKVIFEFASEKEEELLAVEAVPQLLLAPKILLLFEFEALFAFLFLPILDCWTASVVKRKKSEEILKQWLETPVEVEKTDALKEHNSVV